MAHPFSDYIKIIGKGQKGARSLTRDEARVAMQMLLSGDVTHDQRGAFLMLLRTREETPAEVTGLLEACRALIVPEIRSLNIDIDVGCYAGKRRQLPWYLLSVALLARKGYRILMHGAHEPGSGRLYASHVLPYLGLVLSSKASEANSSLDTHSAAYLDLGVVLPALDTLIKLRDQFGLRSCANTLGRLLNPTLAPFSIQGVFHQHLDEKHGEVNAAFSQYASLCFRGDGGDPEVNGERATDLFFTRNGETCRQVLPAQTDTWATKERLMTAQPLLHVWQGGSHQYGEQAVHSTLTAYLMLCENLHADDAKTQAMYMWTSRDKSSLPFAG
mgnify:CR=1 FL=1